MDYLSNVRLDKALEIEDGVYVHNYSELLTALKVISDDKFHDRFNSGSAVCKWIRNNYRDDVLLMRLERAQKRREYVRIIADRINQLEQEKKPISKREMPFYVNVVFFTMFAIVLLSFLFYAFNNDSDSLKKYLDEHSDLNVQLDNYAQRIAFLENQNMDLKEELFALKTQTATVDQINISPHDRIKIEDVSVRNYELIIYINASYIAEFTDTGSMLPVLNSNSIGIQIVPQSETDIRPGDIISYNMVSGNGVINNDDVIIHRVVETGYDEFGWYAYTKGDNNLVQDKEKVRFFQVQRVLVGVLY